MSAASGPLTSAQHEALNRLMDGVTAEQLVWLNGYLAGFGAARQASVEPAPALAARPEVTVLFGSQTGNAEKLAGALRDRLAGLGFPAKLESMAAYKPAQLKRERVLLVVVSTYGEGVPPDNAQAFHEFLSGKKAPKLDEGLRFSVLALGDSSYEHFCQTGREMDARLEALGAARLAPRVDCDVDFEDAAEAWTAGVLAALGTGAAPRIAVAAPAQASSAYSKKHPYPAALLENIRLTGRGSSKDVRHIELSLAGSGLRFEPGDALGVYASNWPHRVAELLESLGLSRSAAVPGADGGEKTLEEALLHDYEITTLTRPFLEKYALLTQSRELSELLKEENRAGLREYSYGREILDVVRRYPLPGLAAGQFVSLLRKLQPRQYSIASSHNANPEEVHLTVGVVRYESHGLPRQGVASTFLAERVGEEGRVPVYVDSNPNFRLPSDPGAPIIMVGPGTGVAPFRAFLEEREAAGAKGKNWLFFGDRNFDTDFLYQREWLEHRKNGLLARIDVAFSRDGADKVYVQHRMLEQSRALYAWLQEGAYFYVCGDAQRMAPDVHAALVEVLAKEGGLSLERAAEAVQTLQAEKRYQRDIY
jgi:sulfite reductase (NADPH) flavoprotein alpha-component